MIIIRVDDENPWFSLVFNLVLMNFDSNFPGSNGLNLEIKVKMIQIWTILYHFYLRNFCYFFTQKINVLPAQLSSLRYNIYPWSWESGRDVYCHAFKVNTAWHFWLSTRFWYWLIMKSVQNFCGQFFKIFKKQSLEKFFKIDPFCLQIRFLNIDPFTTS